MKHRFEYRVNFHEALDWQLHKTSLHWKLIDQAEKACEKKHPGFMDLEIDDSEVNVDGDDFVVLFEWTKGDA